MDLGAFGDTLISIEQVSGSQYGDRLWGDNGENGLWGGEGNDLLDGNGGYDALFGEGGNDELRGDYGNDVLNGGAGDDLLRGGYGQDYLWGGTGRDVFAFSSSDLSSYPRRYGVNRYDRDEIGDFSRAEGDVISFTFDPDPLGEGNVEFSFKFLQGSEFCGSFNRRITSAKPTSTTIPLNTRCIFTKRVH